jgi:uncharacterized protein involved in exopolysaccharide biosynthesis
VKSKHIETSEFDIDEEITLPPVDGEASSITLFESFQVIWSRKKFIALVTAAATIAAVIISLLLPETFKSTASILPETDKGKLPGLGSLADLASMAGVSAGETSPVKLYPSILKSEAILKNVIYQHYKTQRYADSVNLIQFWDIKAKTPKLTYELTLKTLRDELDVSLDAKTNIIVISLETEDPDLSADVINTATSELDKFMRTKRATNATKQREWIEARLKEVQDDLSNSENQLKYFRDKNRQVAGSPQLLLEQERMLRNVQINSTLFSELKKQFELIRIEEIKNTPIVNILDAAVSAGKKEHPKRSIIVISGFLIALLGSMAYVVLKHVYSSSIREYIQTNKSRTAVRAERT